MVLSLFGLWTSGSKIEKEVSISQALADIKAGKINEKVEVMAEKLGLTYKDKR